MIESKKISDIVKNLTEEIEKLEKQANNTNPVPVKLSRISDDRFLKINVSEFKINNSSYNSYSSFYNTIDSIEKLNERNKTLLNELQLIEDEIELQHSKNKENIEHNQKVIDNIKFIMNTIGVRDSYSEYSFKTNRSRKKTQMTHTAGYIKDLNRVVSIDDGYNDFKRKIEDKKIQIKKKYDVLKSELVLKEKEKEKKLKETKKEKLLATLKVKYSLDFDSDEKTILEHILNKDKYLELAYAMEQNRNNWNDGYSKVKNALNSFLEETEEDIKIVEELESVIGENWDGDGRIFRNINYSYDVIYGMADKELFDDVMLLSEYIDLY